MSRVDQYVLFNRLYAFHDRHKTPMFVAWLEKEDAKRRKTRLSGIVAVSFKGSRKLVFDPTLWKPKIGVKSVEFEEIESAQFILLKQDQGGIADRLLHICLDHLESISGSGLSLTPDFAPESTMWLPSITELNQLK